MEAFSYFPTDNISARVTRVMVLSVQNTSNIDFGTLYRISAIKIHRSCERNRQLATRVCRVIFLFLLFTIREEDRVEESR